MEFRNGFVSTTSSVKVLPKKVFAELPQTYTLSEEQKKYLADNGFLVIKELIDFPTLYSFKKRFSLICKGIEDKGNMLLVNEPALLKAGATGEAVVNKLQDIHFDEVFTNYTEHPRLLHVVSQIIGEDISVVHSMFINKPPGTSRHPPHQDLFYLPFRPQEWVTAAWTAIDHVFPENGCLFVVPGSHRDKLHEHGKVPDANRLYHGILEESTVAPEHKRVYLEMSPGDTVLFHPLLVHGSGPNVSREYRRCISCHFANSGCASVQLAGSALAREVEAELLARKGLSAISYTDSFILKSKHVKGIKCNL